MTAPVTSASPSVFGRVDVGQVALRALVVLAGLAAIASIRFAATEPQPGLDIAIVVLVVFSALVPDWPFGLAAVVLVGIDWALAVDDPATPWVIVTGATLAALHSSLALATIAPIGARLERATWRRWVRRTGVAIALMLPTWLAVVVAERLELGASQFLVGLALVVVAGGAMWSRRGDLGRM